MSFGIEGLGFGFWAEGLRVRTFEKEFQMVVLHGCFQAKGLAEEDPCFNGYPAHQNLKGPKP